ncbi:hypothetical protein CJU90_1798 [Yarrowia sp. C11]|nr:hypothetical protein CKK34_5826 [Yarrowia sp. E02]KAG5371737.1 hypothetical protein CJU90_1798 [Yarrowia sp. C11]
MLDNISQACIDVLNITNGLTVKQMIHSIESNYPSVDLSPNPSILVAARINSYIRRLELGQLDTDSTFVQKKLSDNHPKRMIYTIIDRPEPEEIERERREREKEKERKRERAGGRDSADSTSNKRRRSSNESMNTTNEEAEEEEVSPAQSTFPTPSSPLYMTSPQRYSFHLPSDDDLSSLDDSDDEESRLEVSSTAATTPINQDDDDGSEEMKMPPIMAHVTPHKQRGLDQTLAPAPDLSLDITKLFNPYYDTLKEPHHAGIGHLGWINDEEEVGCPEEMSLGDLEEWVR